MNSRKTKKKQTKAKHCTGDNTKYWAGDITKRNIFEKILSIGYEIETSSLAKLTLFSDGTNKTLINTDTARKDLEKFQQTGNIEFEDEEEEESYAIRQLEEIEIPAYDENGELDKNVSFMITNDIADTAFVKRLSAICETAIVKMNKNQLKKAIKQAKLNKYKTQIMETINTSEEGKITANLEKLFNTELFKSEQHTKTDRLFELIEALFEKNNDQYKYKRTDQEGEYDIHFVFWNNINCGVFADVEWVITYYEPKQSKNVILDTFINALRNLIRHLDEYTVKQHGYVAFESKDGEQKIGNPEDRILFQKPGSNTHYLQSHYTKRIRDELELDDVCTTSQMTFSVEIHNAFAVMKQMINDSLHLIPNTHAIFQERLEFLQKIEVCTKKLIEEYNKTAPTYKILVTESNKDTVAGIKNYLGLILFKLSIYINNFSKQGSDKKKYFKDTLYFNSRHINYVLYIGLKECFHELFTDDFVGVSKKEQNTTIVSIIQTLVVNEEVLTEYLLDDENNVNKNAFKRTNVLEKNTKDYGDPIKSLQSYFQFFEEPTDTDDNIAADDSGIICYDWLEYSGVDIYSSKMDIQLHNGKKNKILIEFRAFQRMVMPYMLSIADQDLKTNMTHGTCNVLANKYSEDIQVTSIYNLRRMVELYDVVSKQRKGSKKKASTKKRSKN